MKELISALSNFSSSSFANKWIYDVFLNFRGEDTRNGFTGHLYHALCEKKIHTFIDDRLERGEKITPTLLETIEKSRIAIVILSVNYASSTFCLKELVEILKCIKQKSQLVLPVFYKVDPSDVRHLRGSYGEALDRYEAKFKNKKMEVQNWKSALQEVADLSGWRFEEGDGYEYEFVKKIVEEVSKRINHTPLHVAKYPVGLKSRVEDVISLLDLGCNNEVVMAGIHGIGGIGKTTIACAVHNVIVDQFEGVCFLDVRKRSNMHGLEELQETLLSELTGEKGIKVGNVRKGIPIIRRRLCQKKVLLILDNVNSQEQLEAIAGGVDWFGFGSRIIITTRDKHLLDVHGVNRHYEVKELCFEEALELFSWNALKKNEVDSKYTSISSRVTNYCNGLPLALEIIGSNLFGKTQEEWKSALDTYENIPNKNIQNVLKVSYDDLGEFEKEIFLDIACFFKGYFVDDVINILLDGRGYDPKHGIRVLEEKSLIKIERGTMVTIHDLIERIGKEIVRSKSPSNPENWSRLWYYEDILSILEDDKGTDKIEALVLNMPKDKKVRWNGKALKKMKNLKILIIQSACFSCGPKYLPKSLRILKWKNYPSSSLPSDFHPRKLVVLDLCGSFIKWVKPLKNFESLTKMVLRDCQSLKQVPDVSEAPNLRDINIRNCQNLVLVHDSVGFLDKLVWLDMSGCTNLRILPRSIKSVSLQVLNLSDCFRLQSVPEIFGLIENTLATNQHSYSFTYHGESGCLFVAKFSHCLCLNCGILMLPKLEKLNVGFQHFNKSSGDDQEKVSPKLPVSLCIHSRDIIERKLNFSPTLDLVRNNLTNRHFSTWRPYYRSLKALSLRSSNLTDEFFYQQLPWFPKLYQLDVSFNKFTILPKCMNNCRYLEDLLLDGCKDLREIKGIPPKIKVLSAIDCMLLTSQTSRKFLSQAFHEDGKKVNITVPGFRIPKWLDHRCMGSSISVWFHDEFPRLALCIVSIMNNFRVHISVNGIEVYDSLYWVFHPGSIAMKIKAPYISFKNEHNGIIKRDQIVLKKDKWNHVLFSFDGQDVYGIGVHVYKKEKGQDNVRFIDPYLLKKTSTINHNLNLITCFSLRNKFCPLLNMQVCESIGSRKQAKRFYRFLNNDEPSTQSVKGNHIGRKAILIMLAPTKVKVLMWKIFKNSLPTCYELFRKKLVNSPLCPICETTFETIDHVFFECPWTRPLWFGSDFGWILNDGLLSLDERFGSDFDWIRHNEWLYRYETRSLLEQKFHDILNVHPKAKSVIRLLGNICWTIWKVRNDFVLRDKPINPLEALMTAKAMHMDYSSHLSLLQMGRTHNGPTLEASTDITYPDLQHNKYFTAIISENVKGAQVVSNNGEMEPTCDNGIQVENKAKGKRKGLSNSNTDMEANCYKVSESKQVYEEPTSQEIDEKQNAGIFESKEEVDHVKNQGKYTKTTISEFDNILPKESPKSAKSVQINPPEPYKEVTKADEIYDVANLDTTEQETQEEIVTAPTHEPINKTIEDSIDSNYSQELKQMVEATEKQNPMDVVNDDFDLFENLEFVLSGSSPFSLKSSSHIVPPATLRQEEINKAVEGLGNFLNKNLEDIFINSEERASFDNILTILEKANGKEISVGLNPFIVSLKESVAKILDQYSLCETDVKVFTKMEVEKQEIQHLGQVGKKEMMDINNEISKCETVVESNATEISSLEQQLSALHQKLENAKACHQTNSQKMLVLQAKKKSNREKAMNLLERGQKVMESRVSLQGKYDEALHQQASLENEWTTLKEAFLENKLKFKN